MKSDKKGGKQRFAPPHMLSILNGKKSRVKIKMQGYSVVVMVLVSLCRCLVGGEGCLEEERSLLLQLKSSMNHPNGSSFALRTWVGENCCEWKGVSCDDSTSRVFKLELHGARDTRLGIWYPNVTILAQFKQLQYLFLPFNQIGGSNTLQGLCELKYLKMLDLYDNSLEGNIPPCLGKMQALQFLNLAHNQLQGTISPSTFSNMTMIGRLFLSNNQLFGPFSFSMIANLSELSDLDLSNNYQLQVETELPTWIPQFQLRNLNLANCKLNKRTGSYIPSFISTQQSLEFLDLSNTSLVGDIPSWLLYNSSKSIWLQGNSLSGPFPLPFKNQTSLLSKLKISDNHVHGPLPVNFADIFPFLSYCDMSSNALQGNLPPKMSTESLEQLLLSSNKFSGEMPPSLKANSTALKVLLLSNNRLQGEMLPGNGYLRSLVWLELDNNEFTIPPNIDDTPSLVILNIRNNYLSGDISSWLRVHPYLLGLFLGGNRFEGPVPWQVCQMQSLQILDLSNSNLAGTIPSCLATVPYWKNRTIAFNEGVGSIPTDFSNRGFLVNNYVGTYVMGMSVIDLSLNKLTGTIPFKMGEMTGVQTLNLSHNLLEGSLPTSLQNMERLENLDLSNNILSGDIPEEIINLNFLITFTVAFNNLSGEIPYQGKFLSFNGSSYEGNPGLCGKPLEVKCSSRVSLHPNGDERGAGEKEHGILESDLLYYSCVALSYCLGFWGFIVFLTFNKNWRREIFITMDAFQDWCLWKLWIMECYIRNRCCNC